MARQVPRTRMPRSPSATSSTPATPEGDVTLTAPAGAAAEITAQPLEAGAGHLAGRFGDGRGRWQLFIEADQDIQAMSLLESPTGHIANLASGTAVR